MHSTCGVLYTVLAGCARLPQQFKRLLLQNLEVMSYDKKIGGKTACATHHQDIDYLEMVQRGAARFIKSDYSYESSVTQMLKDLDISSLENRRKMNKLTVLYKIWNNRLCIKENGYVERADSRTRDASRNYKLKSAKTELFKHSFFNNTPKIWNKGSFTIVNIYLLVQRVLI